MDSTKRSIKSSCYCAVLCLSCFAAGGACWQLIKPIPQFSGCSLIWNFTKTVFYTLHVLFCFFIMFVVITERIICILHYYVFFCILWSILLNVAYLSTTCIFVHIKALKILRYIAYYLIKISTLVHIKAIFKNAKFDKYWCVIFVKVSGT